MTIHIVDSNIAWNWYVFVIVVVLRFETSGGVSICIREAHTSAIILMARIWYWYHIIDFNLCEIKAYIVIVVGVGVVLITLLTRLRMQLSKGSFGLKCTKFNLYMRLLITYIALHFGNTKNII